MGRELSQPSACRSKRHQGGRDEEAGAARPTGTRTRGCRVQFAHGSFDDKVGQAHAVADSFGGFVVQSFASQGSGSRIAEGSLVLRVPAESYDAALSRLR